MMFDIKTENHGPVPTWNSSLPLLFPHFIGSRRDTDTGDVTAENQRQEEYFGREMPILSSNNEFDDSRDQQNNEEFWMMPRICVICGDTANGYNFTVMSCESCKAFFRRSAFRKKDYKKCPNGDNCLITLQNRRACKKCRLRRCFEAGMRKERIHTEEQLRARKNARVRAASTEDSTSSLSDSPSLLPSILGSLGNLSEVLRQIQKNVDNETGDKKKQGNNATAELLHKLIANVVSATVENKEQISPGSGGSSPDSVTSTLSVSDGEGRQMANPPLTSTSEFNFYHSCSPPMNPIAPYTHQQPQPIDVWPVLNNPLPPGISFSSIEASLLLASMQKQQYHHNF